ncbi:MAG: hypothetical protein IH784_04890 [Bacteroidetes bacterium]|nr:hypothetical protein [Bacteroidota bacterium]
MMSNMESMELLQAKALGCLDSEDDGLFTKLMKDDENFPWQELGHYQNLVAFLPTLLEIEVPDPEVKDNIARKLYELGEKIKAEKEEDVKQNTIAKEEELDKIEEDGIILEEEPIEKAEIPAVGEDLADVSNTNKEISFKEHGVLLQSPSNDEKKVIREPLIKKQQGEPETKTTPTQPKKEFEQKNVKNYVSKFPTDAADVESSKSKSGLIVTIILFVVTLLALIFVYFKLSSDIQENRDKIDRLERQIGTEIMLENISLHKTLNT